MIHNGSILDMFKGVLRTLRLRNVRVRNTKGGTHAA